MPRDYSPYQKKIINRYYSQADDIGYARLAELTSEIFLAEGKKADRLWKSVEGAMKLLKLPPERIDHLMAKRDVHLLAELVKELTSK